MFGTVQIQNMGAHAGSAAPLDLPSTVPRPAGPTGTTHVDEQQHHAAPDPGFSRIDSHPAKGHAREYSFRWLTRSRRGGLRAFA